MVPSTQNSDVNMCPLSREYNVVVTLLLAMEFDSPTDVIVRHLFVLDNLKS